MKISIYVINWIIMYINHQINILNMRVLIKTIQCFKHFG